MQVLLLQIPRVSHRCVAIADMQLVRFRTRALCHGVRETVSVPDVPTADGSAPLTLTSVDGDPLHVTVDPWN